MGSTVLTLKAHNYQITEVRNTDLAHPLFTHHLARMAGNLEDSSLLIQEFFFLKRFGKV